MRLEIIDGMRIIIIALLAYIPTVTISGWFTAWVAKRCDDELPERLGFLTLDPFAHFSFFGFTILLIGELFGNYLTFFKHIPGFGRFMILDPQPLNGKMKAVIEFFARSFAHFVMLTCSIAVLFLFFRNLWLLPASMSSVGVSPMLMSCKDVLLFFFNQNMVLCGIYFLFGIADTICFFRNVPRMFSLEYFVILVATLLLLGTPVDYLLSFYVRTVYHILAGLVHG